MKVSVITPSRRPDMLPRLIGLFLAQDYPDKELNILSDGEGFTLYTSPDKQVWHWGADNMTVGQKRNELVKYSRGEIILHMDDDDYYAPDWISRSVQHLLESKADTTGLRTGYFYRPHDAMWRYEYPANAQPYVMGATLCYHRRVWEKRNFPHKMQGEDAMFCAGAGHIKPHDYSDGFCAMIHGANTCSHLVLSRMRPIAPDYAHRILGDKMKDY